MYLETVQTLQRKFRQLLKDQIAQDVPEADELCEDDCRRQQCTEEEWATSERRIHKAAGELSPESTVPRGFKRQDDAVRTHPEFASNQTPDLASLGDALVKSLLESQYKRENSAGSQKVMGEDYHQPSSLPNMMTYTEAVNEFAKFNRAFIKKLPLLTKARDVYAQAMSAGAELRKVLDAHDENLRSLMTQLEQGLNVHGVKPASDQKNSEPAKVEALRRSHESNRRNRFP
ncbi:MAG: hypothetical protein ABSF15_15985 [Candidatus Sulfotelmatobacter sp.]|jgi:hypothetical protein